LSLLLNFFWIIFWLYFIVLSFNTSKNLLKISIKCCLSDLILYHFFIWSFRLWLKKSLVWLIFWPRCYELQLLLLLDYFLSTEIVSNFCEIQVDFEIRNFKEIYFHLIDSWNEDFKLGLKKLFRLFEWLINNRRLLYFWFLYSEVLIFLSDIKLYWSH
jgi:hypothetical protein